MNEVILELKLSIEEDGLLLDVSRVFSDSHDLVNNLINIYISENANKIKKLISIGSDSPKAEETQKE